MRVQPASIDANLAESLAIEALSFLVDNPESLARFLALTGVEPSALRGIVREPAFLGAVLDHVIGDGDLLAGFVARSGHDPAIIERARLLLTGADWERDTA